MTKVILKGFIIVPAEDLAAVQDELINHIKLTRDEPGCIVFEVTQCEINSNRFDVYEAFIDKAAFTAHQIRVKSSYWAKVTEHVARHYEILQ